MIYQGARRRWLVLVITAIFVLSLALPAAAAGPDRVKPGAGGEPPGDFVPGEVIVKFKEGVRAAATMQTLAAKHRAFGLAAVRVLPYEAALFTTTTDVTAAVAALQRDPRVEFAQPNYIYRALGAPNDPLWSKQWGMHCSSFGVQAVEAWTHTKGSADIVVAVIDTGIDYTHEDLAANMWTNPGEIPEDGVDNDRNGSKDDVYGYDFINDNSDPLDDDGHGTHVAGIVAATANNAKGIAGTAPGVRLMAVKALDSGGSGTTAAIVNAINYAATNGAQVVNMSFGGTGFDPLQYNAIAAHPGVLFVAAAGNDSSNNDTDPVSPASFTIDWNIDTNGDRTSEHFPALPHIMSVAALAKTGGDLTTFSNFGATSVDLAAPGEAIMSAVPQYADAGAALAVDSNYQTMFWGFGAEDLSTVDEVYDSVVRTVYDFFGLTPAMTDPTTGGTPLLVVDDDQSGDYGSFSLPDVSTLYLGALSTAGYVYDLHVMGYGENGPSTGEMANTSAVIWFTGESWSSAPDQAGSTNLTPTDQTNLSQYLDAGGKLFLSGRNAGYAIEDTPLYTNYLKAEFITEVNGLTGLRGVAHPYTGVTYEFAPEPYFIDVLRPRTGAAVVLQPDPYAAWDGTSMAAPFVAAGGALVLSLRPDLSPEAVIDLLNNNVTKLAPALTGKVASGGTLNLARALAAVPPGVKSTVPAHGATGVAVNTNITVTFSESVIKGVYFDGITISGGGTTVSHTYGLSGSMLTLNPDANLAHSTVYTVTIPAGAVQDAAGNPSDAHSFSFTTQAAGGGGGGGGGAPAPPAPPEAPGPPAGTGEFTATGGAQSVSLLDGQVTLDLPAGALPEGAKVTVTLAADTPENLPAGAKAVSAVFSFKSTAPLAKPVRVSIRYEADKLGGLDPQALMVFRENPDGTWQRVGGKLDRAAQAAVVELDGFSSYTVLGTPKTFGDIKGHWAQADIELLAARGLVQGRAAGKFAPGAPVTRAEMAALLVRLTGAKEVTPAQPAFTDVAPGAWYYSAIETAVRAGLFKGYADGSFQPDATLTREQLAALAVRLTGAATGTTQLPFADRAAIAPWAEEAVAAAYAQGLLRGVSDTEFAPQMSVTRAQAATIMVRLAERKGLFEVTITATGTLVWNTLVGGFWELAADQETYVLLPDPRHKAAAAQLKQFENQEITVTGYIQTGPNIYMRGPLLRILNVTPTG
ncbi:MAG: S8 family serine peptidase [Bacillota bacterium]